MTALDRLPNLGIVLRRRLAEIGVVDAATLERVGPARAYRHMTLAAGRRLPVCYYLYSSEGALRGMDWRCLSDAHKTRLRREAGLEPGARRRADRAPTRSGRPKRSTA